MNCSNKRKPDYEKLFNSVKAYVWTKEDRRSEGEISIMFSLHCFYKDFSSGAIKTTMCFREKDINDILAALRWVGELRVKGC